MKGFIIFAFAVNECLKSAAPGYHKILSFPWKCFAKLTAATFSWYLFVGLCTLILSSITEKLF